MHESIDTYYISEIPMTHHDVSNSTRPIYFHIIRSRTVDRKNTNKIASVGLYTIKLIHVEINSV